MTKYGDTTPDQHENSIRELHRSKDGCQRDIHMIKGVFILTATTIHTMNSAKNQTSTQHLEENNTPTPPVFSITMATNPKWPQMQRMTILKRKLAKVISEITTKNLFGPHMTAMYTIECSKPGFPNAHVMAFQKTAKSLPDFQTWININRNNTSVERLNARLLLNNQTNGDAINNQQQKFADVSSSKLQMSLLQNAKKKKEKRGLQLNRLKECRRFINQRLFKHHSVSSNYC